MFSNIYFETFCSKTTDFDLYQVLCAKLCWIFSNIYFGTFAPKTRQEKLLKFIKIKLYQALVWQNVSVKIGSISFFSSSNMQKFHHFLGCHAVKINFSLIFFCDF